MAAGDTDNLTLNAQPLVDASFLCDRFVLVGNELKVPREVRYRRGRNQSMPQSNTDFLGVADMNDNRFYEPTLELPFVHGLHEGRFCALLLPTACPDVARWQFFVDNQAFCNTFSEYF